MERRIPYQALRFSLATALLLFLSFVTTPPVGAQGPLDRPQVWVDGELFDSIVTRTSFKPTAGRFDELYMGGNGFLGGVPLISDSGPGDRDYNGGRWHANVLRDHVDPNKYVGASSVEELDVDDFMSTDMYFECPLLPRRGRR
jgi:hypothetical protein